jgi:hypothetical protein
VLPRHNTDGLIKVGKLFEILTHPKVRDNLGKFYFDTKKYTELKTFPEVFEMMQVDNVMAVVAFETSVNTTHCITWDFINKKILDPDVSATEVYSFNSTFDSTFHEILNKLHVKNYNANVISYVSILRTKKGNHVKK